LFFVAECDGEVIGTVMAGYDGHRGWIYSLAVKPEARSRGTGRQLIRHAETALARAGCAKVNLQVVDENKGVVEFYRKAGYAVEPRISMGKLLTKP
jgi:ribosomal protein S18 acetylase RimI-like enzyme